MKRNINRRDALRCLGAGAAAGALLPGLAAGAQKRPNIIFILTDDHRWDAFGFMDKPWLKTPNMDRLAAEGVHFQNSFVTTSLCSPSRASFLTGQYAHCHGVMNNTTPWRDSNTTWLELLHAAGYYTGFIGKWHMPGKGVPDLKGQGKVDRMVSFNARHGQGKYFDCPLMVDGQMVESEGYITDILTDYALEFLNNADDRPFCLYLSHKAVHAMFVPPPRYEGALKDAPLPELQKNRRRLPMSLDHILTKMNFHKMVQGYYEGIMGLDDGVGAVLDWLDRKGLAEDTIVVYAGDNGFLWGEHGLVDKRYAYEESMRIAHLMRYPRLVPAGREEDGMVLNTDLMPTLLSACGLAVPSQVQGMSYMDLAAGKEDQWRHAFYYEYFKDGGYYPQPPCEAVRTDSWKYITYQKSQWRFPDELFNLEKDPGEMRNLANDPAHQDKLKQMKAMLQKVKQETEC